MRVIIVALLICLVMTNVLNAASIKRSLVESEGEDSLEHALRSLLNTYNMVDDEDNEHQFDQRSNIEAWKACRKACSPRKLLDRKFCIEKCNDKFNIH